MWNFIQKYFLKKVVFQTINNEYVDIVYKGVGKIPEFRKIRNTPQDFEELVGGEIKTIEYEDFIIVYKKDSDNLRANIYIDTNFLSLGLSIKGTLFAINQDESGIFKSLNQEQAIKCKEIFIRKSFNYENFDEKSRYIGNTKKRKFLNYEGKQNNRNLEIEKDKSDVITEKNLKNDNENRILSNVTDETVLKMILKMQFMIFDFIKNAIED